MNYFIVFLFFFMFFFFKCLLFRLVFGQQVTMVTRVKQHQGRGLLSLFSCCFKENDQPEITHCHDNMTNMVSLEPPSPRPPPQELDLIFTELVVRKSLVPRSASILLRRFSAGLCSVLG